MKTFFDRIKTGLQKSKSSLQEKINFILPGKTSLDDEVLEELEEALIATDIGYEIADEIIEELKKRTKRRDDITNEEVREIIQTSVLKRFLESNREINLAHKPAVILVVGVNGSGKTTTIGKLAKKFTEEGKKVLIAAGDTFRAAAIEQLAVWVDKCDAEIVRHQEGADPSAVIFDALSAAKARNSDIVLVDTAGRLHSKVNLMEELKKIHRVIQKAIPTAPHETLLVLDGTVGQNALQQAKTFNQAVKVTGIVITKLDGTAKGGVIVHIENEMRIPVKFIGVGESVEDLNPFDPQTYSEAII
ncbi:MAG: signal recognition particle-docking protein FtsY [Nitrospinae bacterium]|nr:signal recognition particle-docking protein FtsY [Nitrospinota bacterium]